MLLANFKPKRTAAASRGFLRQHGFLVAVGDDKKMKGKGRERREKKGNERKGTKTHKLVTSS